MWIRHVLTGAALTFSAYLGPSTEAQSEATAFVGNAAETATHAASATLTNSQGQLLRWIGPQRFEMGARDDRAFRQDHSEYNSGGDDRPIHPVVLTRPFYIATTEVTRGQFARFVRDSGYVTTAEQTGNGIVGWDPIDDPERDRVKQSFSQQPAFTWRSPGFEQSERHPVVGVSYEDAVAYCRWLSEQENATYRLPTEAEWECVCRAGTTTSFSFGDQYRRLIHRHANIGNVELEKAFRHRVLLQWLVDVQSDPGDGFVHTAGVGSFAANPWGIYDLHGNVWEWCQDRYLDTFYDRFDRDRHQAVRRRAIDPRCDERWNEYGDWRVIRGGSWFNSPIQARSGVRSYFAADAAACYLGFRIVREADEALVQAAQRRHQASQQAIEQLAELAERFYEPHDGQLQFEFRCDRVSPAELAVLERVRDSLEIELKPPGELTRDLIDAVMTTPNLAGVTFRVGGSKLSSESFSGLRRHPELLHVQITEISRLDNDVFDHLSNAAGLVTIHLQGDGITDEGFQSLRESDSLAGLFVESTNAQGICLERFRGSPLSQVGFGNLSDQGAARLGRFPTLRTVRLAGSPLTDVGMQAIAKLERVVDLSLRGCDQISDSALSGLKTMRFLERVDLRQTDVGAETAAALATLPSLRDLQLSGSQFDDDAMRAICECVSLRNLTIEGDGVTITDAGLDTLWRLVNLRELSIVAPSIKGKSLAVLAELPELQRLRIASPNLSPVVTDHLAKLPSLEVLTIGDRSSDAAQDLLLKDLSKLSRSETLRQVTLVGDGDWWTNEALESIRRLNPSIEWRIQ
jgi:formylglycine-generating enzyme required for sulfatase activity